MPRNDKGPRYYSIQVKMTGPEYHTIVVGGGIAGLTCAAYLAKEGRQVLLVEKNKECGGLVNTFSHKGFRFEAGIRALENAGIILPMLKELDIHLDFVKSSVSVGLENKILNIDDTGSLNDYALMLKGFYPDSITEIDEVISVIRKIMKHMDVLYGIENPNFKDLRNDRPFLFKELLPWLPRFMVTINMINRMNMPVEEYVSAIVKDQSLRDIITQHFFRSTPAFFALSYFSLYLDYFYPVGGVGRLAEAVENSFLESGGEILRETVIAEVSAHEKTVSDLNNNKYRYQNLVWAADLKTFYRITNTSGLPPKACSRFELTKSRLLQKRGGDSVFTLYLGVDEPKETFSKIAKGHFFYTPSRTGLGETHRSELDRLLQSPGEPDKSRVFEWLDKFITLNTFEISIPVLKDPGMAPEGKTGLIVSLLAEYDLFKKISLTSWYPEFISTIEDKIIRTLAATVYPMLKDKVLHRFSFSPLSYENRVSSSEGAITGWSFQEQVPVVNRILSANKAVDTPLPSVYQAGQWTYSPAGVPMSILTGRLAARKISGNKTKKK